MLTIWHNRGPTLEEIAKIFDGRNAEVANVKTDIGGDASARTHSSANNYPITEIHIATGEHDKNMSGGSWEHGEGTGVAREVQHGSGGYNGQYWQSGGQHQKELSGSSDGFGGRYHAR
jgi:hypothetical protein